MYEEIRSSRNPRDHMWKTASASPSSGGTRRCAQRASPRPRPRLRGTHRVCPLLQANSSSGSSRSPSLSAPVAPRHPGRTRRCNFPGPRGLSIVRVCGAVNVSSQVREVVGRRASSESLSLYISSPYSLHQNTTPTPPAPPPGRHKTAAPAARPQHAGSQQQDESRSRSCGKLRPGRCGPPGAAN